MTANGAIGSSTLSLISLMFVSMMYPTKVFARAMVNFPRKQISVPIPLVTKKLPECLRARANAAIALEQKFSPVSAT